MASAASSKSSETSSKSDKESSSSSSSSTSNSKKSADKKSASKDTGRHGSACSAESLPNDAGNFSLEKLNILSTLGTGTFGRVMLVRHKESKRYYALKILGICDVIRLKQVEHIKNEKSILNMVQHPFIVNMLWTHHDPVFLYMLLEYVPGGELFTYLRNAGRFSNEDARFYTAEIVCALDYLHAKNIVYRDMKPENLLLDKTGHIKITDFGFGKKILDRTWTLCGTPEYLAPEIIQSKGYNKGVDWWALGILIYEMVAGYPPFFDENPFAIYEKILSGKIDWPRHIDPVAKDLIKKLLVADTVKRFGNTKNGAEDVKKHRWFKSYSWDDVYARNLKAPIIPRITHEGDTQCFDSYPEEEWKKKPAANLAEQDLFCDF